MSEVTKELNRRELISALGCGALLLLAGCSPGTAQAVRVGRLADFTATVPAAGSFVVRSFQLADGRSWPILIAHTQARATGGLEVGGIYLIAMSLWCSHQGVSLIKTGETAPQLDASAIIECPAHQARFDANNGNLLNTNRSCKGLQLIRLESRSDGIYMLPATPEEPCVPPQV